MDESRTILFYNVPSVTPKYETRFFLLWTFYCLDNQLNDDKNNSQWIIKFVLEFVIIVVGVGEIIDCCYNMLHVWIN